jgi:hypothetical protein
LLPRRWLLLPGRRLLLARGGLSLLPFLPLLLLLRQVMPDGATGRRANDPMMTSHVSCDPAHDGTLDAPFRLGTVRANQEHETQQGRGQRLHLHCHASRHTITPFAQ